MFKFRKLGVYPTTAFLLSLVLNSTLAFAAEKSVGERKVASASTDHYCYLMTVGPASNKIALDDSGSPLCLTMDSSATIRDMRGVKEFALRSKKVELQLSYSNTGSVNEVYSISLIGDNGKYILSSTGALVPDGRRDADFAFSAITPDYVIGCREVEKNAAHTARCFRVE